jgi:hypothetical protein
LNHHSVASSSHRNGPDQTDLAQTQEKTMTPFSALRALVDNARQTRTRLRNQRIIADLSPDILKDIGYPVATGARLRDHS